MVILHYFSYSLSINPFLSGIGIFAIALGAGSAGALNQWYERDLDAQMERTKNRPIPRGVIQPSDALAFGLIGCILSVIILGLSINWYAGFFLFLQLFFILFFTLFF